MAKRFFIGSSFFLLTLLLLWGVYFLFFQSSKKEIFPVETPTPVSENKEVPIKEESSNSIQVAVNTPIISPFLSPEDGGTIFYINKNTGTFEKFGITEGKITALSNTPLSSPIAAIWTKNADRVFVKESSAKEISSFRLFSLKTNIPPISLKHGISYLSWDELENNILYLFQDDSGNVSLDRSLPDGSQWKKIISLPSSLISFTIVPKSPTVAFWKKSLNNRISDLQTVSITNNETKILFSGKYGADYLFSPNGENILLSWAPEKNGPKMSLALLNKNGGEYTDLNFPTLVQKCTWSSNSSTLFCALPGSVPKSAVMPDAWLDRSFQSADTFWKIDTKTGKSTRLVPLENMNASYDASQLFLSPDESLLFFVNRTDSKLYSISL